MCEEWEDARYLGVFPMVDRVIVKERGKFMLVACDYCELDTCPWCGTKLPDDKHE